MPTSGSKELRVGVTSPLEHIDPRRAHDAVSHMVLAQVFETPYGPSTPPEPLLMAERFEGRTTGGRTTYTARVRPGTSFSDGTPVTVEHILRAIRDLPLLVHDARLSRRDDALEITVPQPFDDFEHWLSKRWATVYLESEGSLLGTGPFMFAPFSSPGEVRLLRNPHYREPVPLDALVFRVFTADLDGGHPALVAALEAGEIHLTSSLTRDEVGGLRDVRKLFHPGESTAMLFFNTQRRPFSNRALRRAMATAIDRYELARVCHPESPDVSARGLLPPRMSATSDRVRHDPGEARLCLERAGEALPADLRTIVVWGARPYLARPTLAIEELNRQLADFGTRLNPIYTTSPDEYFAHISGGDYDAVLGGWIPESEDPVDFLESTLSSERVPGDGYPTALTANFARWNDEATDKLLRRCRAFSSAEDMRRLIEHVGGEAPLLPLMHGLRAIVHTRDVRNFDAMPTYVPSFANVDLDVRS
jgi:ABC-type transport system substrate-binding protein